MSAVSHRIRTKAPPSGMLPSGPKIQPAFAKAGHSVPGFNVFAAEFRAARWTVAELDEWYRYIIPKLTGPEIGISSSDLDEKATTLAIGVINEASRAKLESRLTSLAVSCNLVTTEIQ